MKQYILLIYLTAWTIGSLSAQSLEDYQQLAVEGNPAVRSKYKAFEAAMTRVQQANSLPDPSLSFGYFISPVETRVGPQRARFSLSQMFPWFGTLKAQGDVASLTAEATYQQFVEAQNSVRFEVAEAYYPLQELEGLLAVQVDNLELLKSWKRLAIVKYENGETALADVFRIDLLIKELETELSLIEGRRKPLTIAFNRLLNRDDEEVIAVAQWKELDASDTPAFVDWSTHPRMLELQKRIAAKQALGKAIEKQGLPKIGAGLDYVIVGERDDAMVPDNGRNAFMPMVTVSLPIFRKKYSAAIDEAELQKEAYELDLQSVENELVAKLEQLRYEIQRETELSDLYQRQIQDTEQIQRLLLSGFSNAGSDLDELLRIQMQQLNYEIKLINAKTRTMTAIANKRYILGEGI
ncbi:MAG: TolC family protein [Cyclobacteriaceae bacterium]